MLAHRAKIRCPGFSRPSIPVPICLDARNLAQDEYRGTHESNILVAICPAVEQLPRCHQRPELLARTPQLAHYDTGRHLWSDYPVRSGRICVRTVEILRT